MQKFGDTWIGMCHKYNMVMKKQQQGIFQKPIWVAVFALSAAIAWGWAFPLVKLGMSEFGITADMTGSKMLFAGIRFAMAGLITLAITKGSHKSLIVKSTSDWLYVLAFALVNTTLHYIFFYIGISHSAGSRAAILNSSGSFMLVLLACLFFKSDRFTIRKITGCAIGFAGILALNLRGGESGQFTMMGDGMMILSALCAAFAGLMTRGVSRRVDIVVGTGYSLAIGGALLVVQGVIMGGTLPNISIWGITILTMLISISTFGFALYNKLLSCNPMGKVAIYNSLIPIVGTLSSCLCLHEPFYWDYLIAAILATLGIYIINRGKK